jgi:histone H3/H4
MIIILYFISNYYSFRNYNSLTINKSSFKRIGKRRSKKTQVSNCICIMCRDLYREMYFNKHADIRHHNRRILRDNIQGINKGALRRLARRGGVKRISGLVYEEMRGCLKVFLENVLRDAITYTGMCLE